MRSVITVLAFVSAMVVGTVALTLTDARASTSDRMVVYATPTCGCCMGWVEHMRESGYDVEVIFQDDLSGVRARYGVPVEVTSCHLGIVEGYVVEGHVPADVVQRLVRERPEVTGVAVPGMVAGTPGMEMPDGRVDPYDVYTFDESGPLAVYESRR